MAVAASEGAILAHSVKGPGVALKKGEVLSRAHVAALERAGLVAVIAARLEADDVAENLAALRLATRVAGPDVTLERAFTGRCNLLAAAAGLVRVEAGAIDAINAVDEAITLATLAPWQPVAIGDMIATVKIIPFAVPGPTLDHALRAARPGAVSVAPFRPLRVGVASTMLPGLKPSTIAKTLRVLDERLAPAGAVIVHEVRARHDVHALATAIVALVDVDVVIVFGASAITDRRDVVPLALEAAGGRVEHLGMPVDPGNLLLLGRLPRGTPRDGHDGDAHDGDAHGDAGHDGDRNGGDRNGGDRDGGDRDGGSIPVIGAPGCARSPKENGFDWVLRRLLVGVPVGAAELRGMGVGGLLNEITVRPQLRREPAADDS